MLCDGARAASGKNDHQCCGVATWDDAMVADSTRLGSIIVCFLDQSFLFKGTTIIKPYPVPQFSRFSRILCF